MTALIENINKHPRECTFVYDSTLINILNCYGAVPESNIIYSMQSPFIFMTLSRIVVHVTKSRIRSYNGLDGVNSLSVGKYVINYTFKVISIVRTR